MSHACSVSIDLARRRERDEPLPLRVQDPHVTNRPLADVLGVFLPEIARGWEAFHPAGRNHRLRGCFLSVLHDALEALYHQRHTFEPVALRGLPTASGLLLYTRRHHYSPSGLLAACTAAQDPAAPLPPTPPPPITSSRGRPRQVDTSRHFCPNPDCAPLFLTDGFREYMTALLVHYGHGVQPEHCQATGPGPKPRWMPMPQLLYRVPPWPQPQMV